jgi:type II secretory pathway component PulK
LRKLRQDNFASLFSEQEVTIGPGSSLRAHYLGGAGGVIDTGYGLFDEERKININTASQTVLRRFFRIVIGLDDMEAQELAASIIDWRDKDAQLSIPLGSAEDSYYRNLASPYKCKDSNFETLDEIILVKGVTRDIFEKIKDYLTVYGDGKININTASRAVLLSLGLAESTVDKIMSFRSGEDTIAGSDDDNMFVETSGIIPTLNQKYPLNKAESNQLASIIEQYLTVNSHYFTVKSVVAPKKRNSSMLVCVIDRKGKIIYWHES